nr:MAG TPA: hypothetical protein [Caudoviricetes sp.]
MYAPIQKVEGGGLVLIIGGSSPPPPYQSRRELFETPMGEGSAPSVGPDREGVPIGHRSAPDGRRCL